jgi:hypothetical protein
MKRPRRFNDLGLEMLYRHWYFHRSNVRVVVGLCILTSAFLVLGISHLPNPNAALLFFTVAAALALGSVLQCVFRIFKQQSTKF